MEVNDWRLSCASSPAAALAAIVRANPDLGLSGFRLPGVRPEHFEAERRGLLTADAVEQFRACVDWLLAVRPTPTKTAAVSAYVLKEYVEKGHLMHIWGGVMAAAALAMGYRVGAPRTDASPNGLVYLSLPRAIRRAG